MTEPQSTPVPWEMGKELRECDGHTYLQFSSQVFIYPPDASQTGGEQFSGPMAAISTVEGMGNAHLMFAAPDMFAALVSIKAEFDRESGFTYDGSGEWSRRRGLVEGAINKALGFKPEEE